MDQITILQRAFFNSNKTKDIKYRIQQLKKLRTVLKKNEQELYQAIYKDFKKSVFETYAAELSLVYHDIEEGIKKVKRWSKSKKVKTNLPNLPATCYVIPEPLGVVLVIGAWNYPYQLSLCPLIAAIISGNTVVLKPSELSSHTSAIMSKLINESFDPAYLHVIEGGVPETTLLLEQRFDKIFFTGSTSVGKIIYRAASKFLTPVTLELGGKSPAIVTDDCDLKVTAKRIVWGKFLNAGQTCIAPDYVVVDHKVVNQFLVLLKTQIEAFDYKIENDNYVQIINKRNYDRLINLISKDKLYYGGESNDHDRVINPTVLSEIDFDDPIMKEEIFGPILPVISYSNLDEVLGRIKAKEKPLSCYVFAKNNKIRDKVLYELSFGGGAVNDTLMHISNSNLPFGGVGESGMGSYHGYAGFQCFSHFKSILRKPFFLEPNIKFSPYNATKLGWIKRLLG